MDERESTSGAIVFSPIKWLQLCAGVTAVALLLACTGCSTAEMKGTPFYSGEFSVRQGPVEQRVNAWPLLYYREPALSVLWPMFELTEDHTALRPLFSVYGLDDTNREYNLLWPLVQFDLRSRQNRIFPLYWGDDYRVLFPLYYHFGELWGEKGGSDTLLPLWYFSRKGDERFNLYSPWPLVRVWANQKDNVNGSMVLPLFWHRRSAQASQFYSPLWFNAQNQNGDFWRMFAPLYYEMRTGEDWTVATPLWQQGHANENDWRGMLPFWMYCGDGNQQSDLSAPWPLVRFWSDAQHDARGSHVLPFYWQEHEAGASRFYSVPWSSGADAGGYWRFVPPLFYQASNAQESAFLTPLYARGRDGLTRWDMLLPLWYRRGDETNRFKIYSLFAYFWGDRQLEERGSLVFPLYWQEHRQGRTQFNSWLWMNHTEASGDYWRLLPPLFYQESNQTGTKLVTPLWAQGKSATNDWAALIPLAYWDRQQHTLLSPLWAHWRNDDAETWLAPWTLSWLSKYPERSEFNLLGGLGRASWGDKPCADYLIPLYYHDATQGKLLSPVWLSWREQETQTSVAPWLLSWKNQTSERTDFWLAAGLARASWGQKPVGSYVLPLFYHDSKRLLTPLFGWDDEEHLRYYATPLAGVHTGERSGSWLFPLYSHSLNQTTGEVDDKYLWLGRHTRNQQLSRSWFIPFYYYQNQLLPDSIEANTNRHGTFGKNFWCLPICWYRDQTYLRPQWRISPVRASDVGLTEEFRSGSTPASVQTNTPLVRDHLRSQGVFPLWSAASQVTPAEGRSNQESSVLLWLYDYKHELGPLPGARSSATNDYTRARVLWRLWHYEKLNGDVSVDVFPGLTYDRKTDGFKKVSFLWRFFRYERGAAGGTKMDLLFLPLKR